MSKPISEDKQLDWETKIREQQESGLSINEWCRNNQITKGSFHYWKEKLSPKALQKTSFTELSIKIPDAISLETSGITIRITSDCDPHLRKEIISLFAGGLC